MLKIFNRLLWPVLSLLFAGQAIAMPENMQFEAFLFNERLPSNSVNRIYHDREGYMWFGTRDGLCRFDGYDIKIFRSSPLTPGKLGSNEIQYIAEDNNHRLWVGTFEGVSIIDKKNFTIKPLKNIFIEKERINSIIMDNDGMMWIGTSNYGVVRMNPETEEFVRYSADSDSPVKITSNNISQVYQDSKGLIWLAMWNNGLIHLDYERNTIRQAPVLGNKNNPFRIFQDSKNEYWVCTWGDGIFKLTNQDENGIQIKPLPMARGSEKPADIVYSIVEDNHQQIWVVTFTGLKLLREEGNAYRLEDTRKFFDKNQTQLFHSIVKDNKGNLWLGSIGEGVFQMDYNRLPILNFPLNEIRQQDGQSYVTRFTETNDNEIFLVINRVGLFHFDYTTGIAHRPSDAKLREINTIDGITTHKKTGEMWIANEGDNYFHTFKVSGKKELTFQRTYYLTSTGPEPENSIRIFREDDAGNMWIGTNIGLFYKPLNQNIEIIDAEMRFINDINIDPQGRIWIGTEKNGLFYICPRNGNGHRGPIVKVELMMSSHASQSVQSILSRRDGTVYIATKEGGLFIYDPITDQAKDISGMYSISEDGFLNIIDDNFGNIWLTTLKRIIRYNPRSHASIYYSTIDGIAVSAYFKNAVIKLKSGDLLFGGNNGVCAFRPEEQVVRKSNSSLHVKISDIFVQNKSLFDFAGNSHFDESKNRVLLKHNENSISIEFSTLDYYSAGKIQYAYKMIGVDKDWIYVGNNRRYVNYTNLMPGTYEFQVRSSDENGIWSDNVSFLKVVVNPPFYFSWWAYLIYSLILLTITYLIYHNIANRIRLRNELRISLIDKEKTEELTQIKLRYFTNISHELLTPLTIIMLQIESLQKKLIEHSVPFEIMKENVMRLKRLIKQILVFRKTESGNMKLKVVHSDIVAFVRNICQSNFQPQVNEKEIHFTVDIEYDSYMAYFDPDKLDKIIYNILSNAFKYTPKGGSIAVKMSFVPRQDEMIMRLSVSDTGSGISEQDLPHIFKRFYISSTADQSQSHGIGLSLTYDLLQIHHGKIQVNSQLGEGSNFTIEIPVSGNAYSSQEKAMNEEDREIEAADAIDLKREEQLPSESQTIEPAISLLVVEDNKELNQLIADHFSDKYQVYTAENGLQALQILKDNEIDLIISDVMMPEMDGLTFCKIIKNDLNTSHISILMLTAKNTAEDRIECYNAGADAFIAKPFELAVLNARVKNLIGKRTQKAETFQHEQEINISSMEYNSIDEVFLKQAIEIVEENLSVESFDFDQFSVEMSTSKSTLHRKLKSLTGLSPGEFIRNVRMKHAVQMLGNNIGNISEIAYAVGFNDPKYFSRCFKAEFGITPKEWVDQNKKKTGPTS